jgi:hypothetical protein
MDSIKLVPTLSINYVFGSNKVYIVKDKVIEACEVKIGDRFESETEIIEGVQAEDQVATTQIPKLDTGVKVRIEK